MNVSTDLNSEVGDFRFYRPNIKDPRGSPWLPLTSGEEWFVYSGSTQDATEMAHIFSESNRFRPVRVEQKSPKDDTWSSIGEFEAPVDEFIFSTEEYDEYEYYWKSYLEDEVPYVFRGTKVEAMHEAVRIFSENGFLSVQVFGLCKISGHHSKLLTIRLD